MWARIFEMFQHYYFNLILHEVNILAYSLQLLHASLFIICSNSIILILLIVLPRAIDLEHASFAQLAFYILTTSEEHSEPNWMFEVDIFFVKIDNGLKPLFCKWLPFWCLIEFWIRLWFWYLVVWSLYIFFLNSLFTPLCLSKLYPLYYIPSLITIATL